MLSAKGSAVWTALRGCPCHAPVRLSAIGVDQLLVIAIAGNRNVGFNFHDREDPAELADEILIVRVAKDFCHGLTVGVFGAPRARGGLPDSRTR